MKIFIDESQNTQIIQTHIQNKVYQVQLIDLLHKNVGKSYNFYMDNSLVDRDTKMVKMEAGFVQTKGSNIGAQFSCGVDN